MRWPGLDAARGLAVLAGVVLGVGALLAPEALGPVAWRGFGVADLLPGAFLVVAGAGTGWRHDAGGAWTTRRRWRRGAVLVAAGLVIVTARAGGEPARLVADEVLRLAAAGAIAAVAVRRLPRWLLVPAVGVLTLLPAAVLTGDPLGRGLRALDPAQAWVVEQTLGLPAGAWGVPALSLPAAVALVLVGHAFGVWARRRPPGPATGGALATVGLWCLVGTVVVGQVLAPVPVVGNLPVVLAGVGAGALVLAVGHLVAVTGDRGVTGGGARGGGARGGGAGGGGARGGGARGGGARGGGARGGGARGGGGAVAGGGGALGAVGRTALPVVVVGTAGLALVPADAIPALPVLAAVTAGGVACAGVVALARRLDATGWILRA